VVDIAGDPNLQGPDQAAPLYVKRTFCALQHERYMAAFCALSTDFCALQQNIFASHTRGRINDLFKDLAYDAWASGKRATPEERVVGTGGSAV
jgi:hypothetical protein